MEKKKSLGRLLLSIIIAVTMVTSALTLLPSVGAINVGESENGILVEDWRYNLQQLYSTLMFGSSSCIADLGVNSIGGEPDSDLEIVVGSDEYANYYPELGTYANGIWRILDSQGNLEWAKNTGTDESRSSPAVADINGDGYLEIIGGTTSGWNVEVMDRYGNFIWTFPWPPQTGGPFAWHSSPAVTDVDSSISGLEVFIGNNPYGNIWSLDGDNSDGTNNGIIASDGWIYGGTEGTHWDVLWKYDTYGNIYSSPALRDVDNDGDIEVIIGSGDHRVYILDGKTGAQESIFDLNGEVHASAAIANLDSDPYLEIVMGSGDGKIYCLEWTGTSASFEWNYNTGSAVYSSAALGDIDCDGALEIVDASTNGNIYALSNSGVLEWIYSTGSYIVSSPALADRSSVSSYDKDWPMFRRDQKRTGFYGASSGPLGLDIYIGAYDHYLYLIDGGGNGGVGGTLIDRFLTYGRLYTSPSVADIDGDSKLEIVFYDAEPGYDGHYTYWCIEDDGGNQPLTCNIDLRKNGVPINNINIGEFFDICIIDYTGNIQQVHFSSDENQDDQLTGEWTKWYNWDASNDLWNANDKIMRWSFETPGIKEIWVEIKNDEENYNIHDDIFSTFYFIHITDVHVEKLKDDTVEGWEGMVEFIDDLDPAPSFVVNSGDLVAWGGDLESGEEHYKTFINPLTKVKNKIYIDEERTIPLFCAPGNHDYRISYLGFKGPFSLDNYDDKIYEEDKINGFNYVEKFYDTVAVFSIDSGHDKWPWAIGSILLPEGVGLEKKQIDWLKKELDMLDGVEDYKDTSGYYKVVFMHHPYINGYYKSQGNDKLDGTFLNRRDDFLWACLHYDIDLVLFGHVHNEYINPCYPNNGVWDNDGNGWTVGDNTKFVITNSVESHHHYRKITIGLNGLEIGDSTKAFD